MTLDALDLMRLLLALSALLTCAHLGGHVLARLRQPRVVGEVLGGVLLGPTVLGSLMPDLAALLFDKNGSSWLVLDGFYQIGLLLLMFTSGIELRSLFDRRDLRLIAAISVVGMIVPFIAGAAFVRLSDPSRHVGPTGSPESLALILGAAIAVTSIPVIARIMLDLGILKSVFARVVLSVAIIEDLTLYVILAAVLGLSARNEPHGLTQLMAIQRGTIEDLVYQLAAPVLLLALALAIGPAAYRRLVERRLEKRTGTGLIGLHLVWMMAVTLVAAALGIVPLFGALVAGISAAVAAPAAFDRERRAIRDFAGGFFVPLYFAMVGLRIDVRSGFDLSFFCLLLAYASVAKIGSVYAAARGSGVAHNGAINLAVAINARGGPGIVLASASYEAGIISAALFAALVLLALVTSLAAGSWLGRVVRSGRPLLG